MKATQVQERIESFVNEEKRTKRATGLTMQVGRSVDGRTHRRAESLVVVVVIVVAPSK